MGLSTLAPTVVVLPQFKLDDTHNKHSDLTSSVATLPEEDATGRVPDFVVAVAKTDIDWTDENNLGYIPWGQFRVLAFRTSLIVEIKRPATRSAPDATDYKESLEHRFRLAFADLEEQARLAFQGPGEIKQLILVACSGEWWVWKPASAEDYLSGKELSEGEATGKGEKTSEERGKKTIGGKDGDNAGKTNPGKFPRLAKAKVGPDTYKEVSSSLIDGPPRPHERLTNEVKKAGAKTKTKGPQRANFTRHEAVPGALNEGLSDEQWKRGLYMFDGGWSPCIQYETVQSRQSLSILQQFLAHANIPEGVDIATETDNSPTDHEDSVKNGSQDGEE
ncbi:hypothetical protein H0H81_002026 [Sphagnurus paluster]|uniref:Uncharacterized protein n=1 Tax=Sphagnurus paluster TaxID=117069 RepID=A0A9P7GGY4_9AGAR|nr:hypothetical protein H0H81_002026 [Sphagnurus paluster]